MITIKTNSKKVLPGDIFVALRGIRNDGHYYIEDAIKRGAKKIIAEEGEYSIPYLIVPDTRKYLQDYLTEHYNALFEQIQIIGVTGTNGKTTVTTLLCNALNRVGYKCASIGSLGFFIADKKIEYFENSTPDLCDVYDYIDQAIDEGCQYVVMEVSSHALMNGRVETLSFNHAIFTNLTQDHLDYHVTIENYAMAKQKLFKKIKTNGIAIVNLDDAFSGNFLFPHNHNITFGYNEASDFRIISENLKENETTFKFQYRSDTYQVNSRLVGKFNIYNVMPVIIFLLCIGIDPILVLKTIYSLKSPKGRLEIIPYRDNKIIVDYAHTPDAIIKVLDVAREFTTGKIYVVFGCTGERDRLKRPLMTKIISDTAQYFIVTEDDLYYEDFEQIKNDMLLSITKNNYEVIMDRKEAIKKGISYLKSQDTLLILGKGHEEVLKIREKRIPFNDKDVVLSILEETIQK
jgi:UDP-N-acetylmuramoyl-L-alanyl-D-glutamate--2,6-diaminopimelate ligase